MKTEKGKFNMNLEVEYECNAKYKEEIERKLKESFIFKEEGLFGSWKFWQLFCSWKFWQFQFFRVLNVKELNNPQNTTEVNKNGSKESVNPEKPISEIVKEEEVNSLSSSNESNKKDTAL